MFAINHLESLFKEFEEKYHWTTDEFLQRFDNGLAGDDEVFFKCYAVAQGLADWKSTKKALEEVLVLFQNGSKLSVFEFLSYSSTAVSREKYRYRFMNSKDQEIFRYDNAPHHKSVSSFHHHNHIENKVCDSIAPLFDRGNKENRMPNPRTSTEIGLK